MYAGYTSSRVRSARQPLTITQHATANVKDRNHGLLLEVAPSLKKPEYLQASRESNGNMDYRMHMDMELIMWGSVT